jgi:hypothetical protein
MAYSLAANPSLSRPLIVGLIGLTKACKGGLCGGSMRPQAAWTSDPRVLHCRASQILTLVNFLTVGPWWRRSTRRFAALL